MKRQFTSFLHTRTNFILSIALLLAITHTTHSYDNAHFYRATNLFNLPRLEKDWLTSFDISAGFGSTRSGRNAWGEKSNAFDIYGLHNMHELGVGVPGKNLADIRDVILTELSLVPPQKNFGVFSIEGIFKIAELNVSFTQNLKYGLFTFIQMPIRRFDFNEPCFRDLTPETGCPNNNNTEWKSFLNQFQSILNKYNLCKNSGSVTGAGDLSILLGWTNNYQDTQTIDFIDTTLTIGALLPTGKEKDQDNIFSLPFGYDGHYALPISADIGFGLYEWLTIGAHVDAMFFSKKNKAIRVKTAPSQSGIIKLAKTCATIDRGSIWSAGMFIQADHFTHGASLTLGYSYAQQNSTEITPDNRLTYDICTVNSDEMLKGWKMHTIHFMAEYDFTKEYNTFGPRIGLFYNLQVGGKRVFRTNMAGGAFGLEISSNF